MKSNLYKILSFTLLFIIGLIFSNNHKLFAQNNNTDELLALQYYNNGEFDKALELYEKIYKRNPNLYFYNYYFECLMALNETKKAERLVQGLIKNNPQVFRYQVDLGLIYLKISEPKKAEVAFNDAIKNLVPTESNYMALSQYFLFKSHTDWAKKTFEFAVTKLPDNINIRFQLAHYYFISGQNTDMFEQLYFLIDQPQIGIRNVQQRLIAYLAQDRTEKMAEDFVNFALRKTQRNSQNNDYAEMLLWSYLQVKDFDRAMIQAIAMDRRQKLDGSLIFNLVPVLVSNKKFDKAIEGLNYVIEKGEKSENFELAKLNLLDVRYLKAIDSKPVDKNILVSIESEMEQMLIVHGYNVGTVSLIQSLANLKAYYLYKHTEAKQLLEKALTISRISNLVQAQLKIQLADIKLVSGEHWDASLLYSQVEKDFKHDTIGFSAKFKNAKFFYFIGEFEYALSQLNILRSATSKLIANDAMELSLFITNNIDFDSSFVPLEYYARADFLFSNNKPIDAINTLDSLLNIFPRHLIRDDAFMLKANIFLSLNNFESAANCLENIVLNHYYELLADDALFMLGDLYLNKLNNPSRASEMYWKIINDFPSSVYASDAREKYRNIRANIPTL